MPVAMIETLKIEAMCILAAIIYGIAHDMVTAHVCIEYFTIGHFDVYPGGDTPAWRYALYWGVAATWWVGTALGLLVILAGRVSSRWPRLSARQVAKPMIVVLGVQWVAAMCVLAISYMVLGSGFEARDRLSSAVPLEAHRGFVADWITHLFSYGAGLASALILCALVVRQRWKMRLA